MIAGSISRRYARALMAIGLENKTYEQLGRELAVLAAAIRDSAELDQAFSHPAFRREEREKILEALLKRAAASKLVRNFTMLLLDHDRVGILPDISREMNAMIDEKAGRVNAVVTAATKLNPMQVQQIKTALEKTSGKTVLMEQEEDPALIGGLIAKVGDIIYDGSLRTQLQRLRQELA